MTPTATIEVHPRKSCHDAATAPAPVDTMVHGWHQSGLSAEYTRCASRASSNGPLLCIRAEEALTLHTRGRLDMDGWHRDVVPRKPVGQDDDRKAGIAMRLGRGVCLLCILEWQWSKLRSDCTISFVRNRDHSGQPLGSVSKQSVQCSSMIFQRGVVSS